MQFSLTKESEGSTISMAVMKSSRLRDRLGVVTIVVDSMNMKILVMDSRYHPAECTVGHPTTRICPMMERAFV